MYDCHIDGEMFKHIGILSYSYEELPKYGSILQYFFEFSDSLNEWTASFKSSTDSTSHFEFPNTENLSLTNG